MLRVLTPLAGGIVVGALGLGLLVAVSSADHPTGPGKFSDWTGPKDKFLHVYLWVEESAGCPTAIKAIPTDEAAEIWKKAFTQPKKVVWKIRNRNQDDRWTIQTKPNTDDHLPGAKVIARGPHDAFWSKKPNPVGPPTVAGDKKLWKWMYNVKVERQNCPAQTLDPPIYIRKR